MILVDLEQNSPEWFAEKLGKPSASNASKIITNSGEISKQREGYLYELAGERITGRREEGYQNAFMQTGNERQDESRNLYELMHECEVQKVGVIYKDEKRRFLCSPDGIIGKSHGLEMKNVIAKTQVKYLLDGKLPSDYFAQVQMSLYVSGFDRWDFFTYVPGMKPFILKVGRDEKYIRALSIELEVFCQQLDEITEKIK